MRQVRNLFRARLAATLTEVLVVAAVVVLLALIILALPWLKTDGGPSPRQVCTSQLHALSQALSIYCISCDDYLPCYPGYGCDPSNPAAGATYSPKRATGAAEIVDMSAVIPNSAVRANPKAGIGDNVGAAFPGPNFFRTCFFGKGRGRGLRTGPVGLGTLLTSGNLADSKVLFCPNAKGMPADWGAGNAACNLKDLKKLGGYDATSLTQGNWTKLNGTWQNVLGVYGFQSSYAYRCVPISDAANAASTKVKSVEFTNFALHVTADVGYPQLKTRRSLGQRAIVSDAFSRWADVAMDKKDRRGVAWYAHRDGYNVLYGDGHVRWVDDPAQRIINWNENAAPYAGLAEHSSSIAGVTKVTSTGPRVYDPTAATPDTEGFEIWHYFDTVEGIDTK